MISVDRNTGKVLYSTEIKPEILENLSCKAQA